MAPTNNGTTIDKTITFLMIGMLTIAFMVFTIVGMKRVQATAEQSKNYSKNNEVEPEVRVDISGDLN